MTISKDDFAGLLAKYEANGMLPKGKAADLLESFDYVVNEDRPTREVEVVSLRDDERTTDPEVEPVSKKRSK